MNAPPSDPSYEGRHVIVADDELPMAQAVAMLLRRRMGVTCTVVGGGEDALRVLGEGPCDCLITDMQMPGLHGIPLVRAVCAEYPNLPVIVMTGFPSNFPYVEVIRAGASDFIVKPYHPEELEAKLVRIFRERALLDEHAERRAEVMDDISDIQRARGGQPMADDAYRSLFERNADGMAVADAATWEIFEANQALCELLGRSRGEIIRSSLPALFDEQQAMRMEAALPAFQEGGRGALADVLVKANGRMRSLDMSVSYIALNGETSILALFKDVTEQRDVQRKISDLASTDSLTGLYNKRVFRVKLEAAISAARAGETALTLMFIDLDNFKACNDTHGHACGDVLLQSVGAIIKKHIRAAIDHGFRYGGDEFGVLLCGAASDVSARVGERIRSEFECGNTFGTSMSVGVVQFAAAMSADDFLRAADAALYKAKAAGKNSVWVE